MPIAPLGPVIILFLIILTSPVWLIKPVPKIVGCASIGTVLLFFNFPDIDDYRNHYDNLTGISINDFDYVQSLWNFEYGYDVIIFISTHIFSFDVFYVITIASTLLSYQLFFRSYSKKNSDLSFIIFTSFFLYYISFTLRSTIATAMLALALVFIKNKKQYLAISAVAIASFMHIVAIPFIILLLVQFKNLLRSKLFLISIFLIACTVQSSSFINFITSFFSQNEFINFKFESYAELSEINFNFFLLAWVTIGLFLFVFKKQVSAESLWIYFLISCVFITLSFNSFFMGRATWVASFVLAYLMAVVLSIFILGNKTRFMVYLITSIGAFSFMRFN